MLIVAGKKKGRHSAAQRKHARAIHFGSSMDWKRSRPEHQRAGRVAERIDDIKRRDICASISNQEMTRGSRRLHPLFLAHALIASTRKSGRPWAARA
jgi:hypothetical protein